MLCPASPTCIAWCGTKSMWDHLTVHLTGPKDRPALPPSRPVELSEWFAGPVFSRPAVVSSVGCCLVRRPVELSHRLLSRPSKVSSKMTMPWLVYLHCSLNESKRCEQSSWLQHVSNDCISWNRLRWQKQQLIQLSSWHHSAKVRLVRHTVKETPKWNKCQSVTNVGRRSLIFKTFRNLWGENKICLTACSGHWYENTRFMTTCEWVLLHFFVIITHSKT